MEVQVHRDVGQERDERDGAVRGAAEAGDDEAAVAAAARGVGAEEGRQKMRCHVGSLRFPETGTKKLPGAKFSTLSLVVLLRSKVIIGVFSGLA